VTRVARAPPKTTSGFDELDQPPVPDGVQA